MKKILLIVTTTVFSVCFAGLIGGSASAVDCDVLVINDTGPDSQNQVVCTATIDATVECVNDVYVLNANSQAALTGNAVSGGNVTGGTAISGNAKNINGTTVEIGAVCNASQPQPTQPNQPAQPTVTPQNGSGGGGVSSAPTAAPTAAPTPTSAQQDITALPVTSSNSIAETIAISIIIIATILVTVRTAVNSYSRIVME